MLQCSVVSNITMNGRLKPWRACFNAFLNIKVFFIYSVTEGLRPSDSPTALLARRLPARSAPLARSRRSLAPCFERRDVKPPRERIREPLAHQRDPLVTVDRHQAQVDHGLGDPRSVDDGRHRRPGAFAPQI